MFGSGARREPPEHHVASLGPGRGPWHVGSSLEDWQVTPGRHSEHVESPRPMKTHVGVEKCPTAHVISRILNVVNVVRHYLVMERYSPFDHSQRNFLGTNLRDMGPLLVQ